MTSLRTSENPGVVWTALLAFHKAMPSLRKDRKNDEKGNKYVTLDNILDKAKPVLAENNLFIIQPSALVAADTGDLLVITTRLQHAGGEWIETDCAVPLVGQFKKGGGRHELDPQAMGSAMTYARRYGLASTLMLSADVDDDGNRAARREERAQATARASQPESGTASQAPGTKAALPMDKVRAKREFFAKAKQYQTGSFVVPAGEQAGMVLTAIGIPEVEKWLEYAKKYELHGLRTDCEMVLTELRKNDQIAEASGGA